SRDPYRAQRGAANELVTAILFSCLCRGRVSTHPLRVLRDSVTPVNVISVRRPHEIRASSGGFALVSARGRLYNDAERSPLPLKFANPAAHADLASAFPEAIFRVTHCR